MLKVIKFFNRKENSCFFQNKFSKFQNVIYILNYRTSFPNKLSLQTLLGKLMTDRKSI